MLDSSRLMICMFVMSVMFFNPFNLILSMRNSQQNQPNLADMNEFTLNKGLNSRVLNSLDVEDPKIEIKTEDNYSQSSFIHEKRESQLKWNFNFLASWTFNVLLILFCLIRVYVNGEAYIELDANADSSIWLNYQKGSKNFKRKNYQEAFDYCCNGLKELGQQIPKTKLQLIVGIIWQLIRLVLDKLYIGRVFFKLGVKFYGIKSMKLYKYSSLFYYELHKFSFLNMESEDDLNLKATMIGTMKKDASSSISFSSSVYTTTHSYLSAMYFLLAAYNMSEIYLMEENSTNKRDEFNLCELYFSICLYLKFFSPGKFFAKRLVKYFVGKKLLKKFQTNKIDDSNSNLDKLNSLKIILREKLFLQFLLNFDSYNSKMTLSTDSKKSSIERQRILNLISYKRKLLSTSFLYDLDDSLEDNKQHVHSLKSANGVACDFVLSKFQDFLLTKMANHIINYKSGIVSVDRILNCSKNMTEYTSNMVNNSQEPIDLDEEQNEFADVDQYEFEKLKTLYNLNSNYLLSTTFKNHQDIQIVLVNFLNMLNNWKLRKFDFKVDSNLASMNTQKR
jgi:hypothetical protein